MSISPLVVIYVGVLCGNNSLQFNSGEMYAFIPFRAKTLFHLVLLDLITSVIFIKEYKWS
jgi:hypothetical protein